MGKSHVVPNEDLSNDQFFMAVERFLVRSINDQFFDSGKIAIMIDYVSVEKILSHTYTFFGSKNLDLDYVEIDFEHYSEYLEICIQPTNNSPLITLFEIRPETAFEDINRLYSLIEKPFEKFFQSHSEF